MTLLIGASKQMANVKAMYLNAINVAGTLNFYKSLPKLQKFGLLNMKKTLMLLVVFLVKKLVILVLVKRLVQKKEKKENQKHKILKLGRVFLEQASLLW